MTSAPRRSDTTLPDSREQAAIPPGNSVPTDEKQPGPTARRALTVLVVDDDPDFLLQQRFRLEAAGYAVITAESEAAARELLDTRRADVAVVDLMMEHADAGFSLCRFLKKSRPELPVVLVSSVNNETGLGFGLDSRSDRSWIHADAMLAKPIRFEQLQHEIRRLTPEQV